MQLMQTLSVRLGPAVIGGVVACILALPGPARAAVYCSDGTNPDITGDDVPGSLLSVNDLTLTINSPPDPQYIASDCYGDFDPGNSNPANETAALNTIFGDISISDPDHLFYLDSTGDASDPNGLGGIVFTVMTTGGVDGVPGTWTVTWTDTNGLTPENLPITVDFAVLLNGGDNNAAYLLSDVLLPLSPTSGTGTFDIQFLNNGGQQPTISHLTLAGRIVTVVEVPEPATVTMFGAGLLGFWILCRRPSAGRSSQSPRP